MHSRCGSGASTSGRTACSLRHGTLAPLRAGAKHSVPWRISTTCTVHAIGHAKAGRRVACKASETLIAAAASSSGLLVPQNAAALAQLLMSAGVFTICVAAAAFLVACIPSIWAMARVASRTEAVLRIVETELPESAALLRLSGMEVTDAVSEISSLSSDLSGGLRSAANLAMMTEQGVRQTVDGASKALSHGLLPMAARTEGVARSECFTPCVT